LNEAQLIKALDHDDSYRVIRTLAEASSGKTELVRGPSAGLLVRKYVPRELANERAWKILAQIEHPLLPQVRDLYWLPDFFVAVTTYVDGITLGELVESTGSLGVAEAVHYLSDLCEAASELHAHGIVHRDISPRNAVVVSDRAALIDLGNVRAYVEGAQHDTTTLGTYGFAAPEQFGFAQTDARSDVYALGGLLAYLLTGVNPADKRYDYDEVLANDRAVPPELRLVIQKARAFEPSARYQTAAELAEAAKAALHTAVVVPIDLKAMYSEEAPRERNAQPRAAAPVLDDAPEPEAAKSWVAQKAAAFREEQTNATKRSIAELWNGWKRVDFFTKLLLIMLWLCAGMFVCVSFAAGFQTSNYKTSLDIIYYPFAGILWAICMVMFAADVHRAVVAKYVGELPRALPAIVKSAVKWTFIGIGAVVVMAMLTSLPSILMKQE
jgi:serine/threonine protein kinase